MFFQILTAAEVDYWNGCLEKTYQAWLGFQFSIPDVTRCVCISLSRQLEPSCVSASLPLCVAVYLFLFGTHSLCGAEVCHCAAPPSPPPRLSENICSVSCLLGCRGEKNKLGSYFLSILMRKQCIMGYCTVLRPINSIYYTLLHTCINKMNGITSKIKV